MKKLIALLLALVMALSMVACGGSEDTKETPKAGVEDNKGDDKVEEKDYSKYTIRIYSNSNSTERSTWLINEAKDAGFTISIDDKLTLLKLHTQLGTTLIIHIILATSRKQYRTCHNEQSE